MKAKLSLGGEIDFLTKDEMKEVMDGHFHDLQSLYKDQQPTYARFEQTGTTDSTGVATLQLTGPKPGRLWDVRRINVTGVDPATAVTGKCRVFRNLDQAFYLVDQTDTIPNTSAWSKDQLILIAGEILVVKFSGVAASTQMFATVQVVDKAWSEKEIYTA